MQGICIDVHTSAVLEENKTYFLFDHGINNYYVSRFDNVQAQFGSYRKEMFQVTETADIVTESPKNETISPKKEQIKEKLKQQAERLAATSNFKPIRHIAKATQRIGGIVYGKEYIIGPSEHMPYYNVYRLENPRVPIASYVTMFFDNLRPYDEQDEPIAETSPETAILEPPTEIEEPVNTNTLTKVKTSITNREGAKIEITRIVTKIIKEKKIKKAKSHYEKMELLGQINIFDVLEV